MFANFKNHENGHHEGVIIGWDSRRCGCCEGWKIVIGKVVYLTDTIPKGILDKGPDGRYFFPQKIYLDYEREYLCTKRITILCMTKRD